MKPIATARRHPWLAALSAALLCGGAGWALAGPAAPSARPSGATAELAELKADVPLNRVLYAPTDADVRVSVAKQRLITDCMADKGFDYQPPPVPRVSAADVEYPKPFGLEPTVRGGSQQPTERLREKKRSKAFSRALFGDPDRRISVKGKELKVTRPATGCQADAERRLSGNARVRLLELRLLLGDGEKHSRGAVAKDADLRKVNRAWQKCMARAGHDQKNPMGVVKKLKPGEDVRKSPLAQADLECKETTDYLATAYKALASAQRHWLGEHSKAFAEWKALNRRQQAAAREILEVDAGSRS
ncbi:hypothetical protein [Streptomyces smyrnaeus]|uniref:hypothetical protein n=1 Tax=Streptomyces smyrnaeus TaxID=1387713 RepID=UPI0033FD5C85